MDALHYATHAIDSLSRDRHATRDLLRDHGDEPAVRAILAMMADAEKFILPDCADIIDLPMSSLPDDLSPFLRLPFPITLLEIPWHPANGYFLQGSDPFLHTNVSPSTKRIVLLWEPSASRAHPVMDALLRRAGATLGDGDGFFLLPIFHRDRENYWSILHTATFIPTTLAISPGGQADDFVSRQIQESGVKSAGTFVAGSYPVLPAEFTALAGTFGRERALAQAEIDSMDEIQAVLKFLLVMNCTNASKTQQLPAPEKLNRKRHASGKAPFFPYRILDIFLEPGNANPVPGTGTHASPVRHFRRGHIRQLSPGRLTWVRPAIVNPSAERSVDKTYRLRKHQA